jgi:hypothetical protein
MRTLMIAVLVAALAAAAHAGSVPLEWDPSPGATGYEVEQSTDNGTTWTRILDLTGAVCTGTPARCAATYAAPSTGLVLLRFVAKNAAGKTVRFGEGVWHCETCKPPAAPRAVGVQ